MARRVRRVSTAAVPHVAVAIGDPVVVDQLTIPVRLWDTATVTIAGDGREGTLADDAAACFLPFAGGRWRSYRSR